jgi:hypothetical protein
MSQHRREELEREKRRAHAEKFRATNEAIRADGGALIENWNARIAAGMPMLASPLALPSRPGIRTCGPTVPAVAPNEWSIYGRSTGIRSAQSRA